MALARIKNWISGEVLNASDLNAEINNILNNADDLISPLTGPLNMGGYSLYFDASATISLTAGASVLTLAGGAFNTPQGADIASASTINLDAATGNLIDVTGTTTITAITLSQGRSRTVRFTGNLTLTNGANLVLPGAANIQTAAGDCAVFHGYASSVVRCTQYMRLSGNPVSHTAPIALTGVAGTNTITATAADNMNVNTTGQSFIFTPAATNTGATTLNINSIGAVNIFQRGVACVGGELLINVPTLIQYDGTQYDIVGNLAGIVLGTETATTSGTSVDITSIPAGVQRISVMLLAVSTNGTDNLMLQIGDSGGVETSGYSGAVSNQGGTAANFSASFQLTNGSVAAAGTYTGFMQLVLEDPTDNTWVCSGFMSRDDAAAHQTLCGYKALSATLDRIRLTTTGGANTFDAGLIRISYER